MCISVLLLTKNEEHNLARCLRALEWCEDVVVLDSHSDDETVRIAEEFGARVYERTFDNFAGQRNYALENIDFRHEWILHLDADEVCTPQLTAEIERAIEDPGYDAYRIPSKMIFRGKWLRRAGMYPTYQVRLGRQPVFRFKQVGHGQREAIGPERIGTLRAAYEHYSFRGLDDWFERHNRYSTDEARLCAETDESELDIVGLLSLDRTRRRRAAKAISYHLPFRPLLRFLYVYFARLGCLEGRLGLEYSRMLAVYEAMTDLKTRELQHFGQLNELVPASTEPFAQRTRVREQVFSKRTHGVQISRPGQETVSRGGRIQINKLSIITAAYNAESTIGDTMDSVADQEGVCVEHIVVDGMSTDRTPAIVESRRTPDTVVIREQDTGIYDALNKGIRAATGDIIGILHADDTYANGKVLRTVAEVFEKYDVDCCYGDHEYVGASDSNKTVRYWKAGEYREHRFRWGWMPPHPAFYCRRDVFDRFGFYDTSYRIAADYDFMLRVMHLGQASVAYVPMVLSRMRVGGVSNRSLRTIAVKTREDLRVWRSNDLRGGGSAVLFKNLSKLPQFLRRNGPVQDESDLEVRTWRPRQPR